MLATPSPAPPAGEEWVHEVKWDGIRLLADTSGGPLRLRTRTGRDAAGTFPDLAGLGSFQGAVLDGEVVAMREGTPSFAALAERSHAADAAARRLAERVPVTLILFDVPVLYGVDLTRLPWTERRATLERLALPPRCILSPTYDDGTALWAATRANGLEGVVAKRRGSSYQPGRRSPDWLKSAHRRRRTALVGGWRPESTGSGRLGSLLIGAPDGAGQLQYLGRVGSGLTGRLAADLTARLVPTAGPPFPRVAAADALGAVWVEPSLAVEVEYLARTEAGRLRHPVLLGPREDAAPDPWEVP